MRQLREMTSRDRIGRLLSLSRLSNVLERNHTRFESRFGRTSPACLNIWTLSEVPISSGLTDHVHLPVRMTHVDLSFQIGVVT